MLKNWSWCSFLLPLCQFLNAYILMVGSGHHGPWSDYLGFQSKTRKQQLFCVSPAVTEHPVSTVTSVLHGGSGISRIRLVHTTAHCVALLVPQLCRAPCFEIHVLLLNKKTPIVSQPCSSLFLKQLDFKAIKFMFPRNILICQSIYTD